MFDDDGPLKKTVAHKIGSDLSALSIDDLERRVELLKAEIQRLTTAIEAKRSTMSAAENFFKK